MELESLNLTDGARVLQQLLDEDCGITASLDECLTLLIQDSLVQRLDTVLV